MISIAAKLQSINVDFEHSIEYLYYSLFLLWQIPTSCISKYNSVLIMSRLITKIDTDLNLFKNKVKTDITWMLK